MCMDVSRQVFLMMLHQVADGNNGATANLAKSILKEEPKKVKLV